MMSKCLSIYIHIPFCVRKCLYCDFLSFSLEKEGGSPFPFEKEGGSQVKSYVNLLIREIQSKALEYREHRVVTVFFGGGTPSLLTGGQLGAILAEIRENYRLAGEAEITVEMNPATAAEKKLAEYREAGVNRISIGLQSADDAELARIGRIHDYETFLRTYRQAREAGFRNINIDLMAALPGQDMESYRRTLKKAVELEPEHISAYSLILEEGTWLYEHREQFHFPTEEEDRDMYLYTGDYLERFNYKRYEISNYAKAGYECRHNKVYWQRGDYVGFGLGAASMVGNVRWSNPDDLTEYGKYVRGMAENRDSITPVRNLLSVSEQMEEFMFLGLRLMEGVSRAGFAREFGKGIEEVYGSVLERLFRQSLLEREGDRIRLTGRGIDISNYVMAQFLFD